MKSYIRRFSPLIPLLVFGVAMALLYRELEPGHYREALGHLRDTPMSWLSLAILLTAASLLMSTGYDLLACRWVGSRLPMQRVALTSLVASAFGNALGHSLFTSTPPRYRLYGSWGLSAEEITRIVGFSILTFWAGFAAISGAVFTFFSTDIPASLHLPFSSEKPLGLVLLALAAGYLGLASFRRRPWYWRNREIVLPPGRFALGQIVVASADWVLAALVLFVLLPSHTELTFIGFLGAFLLAQTLGLVSQIPGGAGVFEAAMVVSLAAAVPDGKLLGALLLYRTVYYLGPLLLATAGLAGIELYARRARAQRALGTVTELAAVLVPQLLAAGTFLGGALLLMTGATPTPASRLAWLGDLLPLPLIEMSHFLASVAGGLLLVLARGIQRRLDAAYSATVMLLSVGIVLSLLRGLDWATAGALAVMLIALAPLRATFFRKAALKEVRLSAGWVAGIAIVLAATLWLSLFAYRNVEFSQELWWSFALRGDAPRSLRALVAAAALLVILGAARLLRPAPPDPEPPTREEMEKAWGLARASTRAAASLVLLGDKNILFSPRGNAFLMYAVQGSSWIALGDPVGPEDEAGELAWRFRDLAERHGDWTVFYQVSDRYLHRYVDMGLSLLKLGEAGRVSLVPFEIEGGARKDLRQTLSKVEREGSFFELLEGDRVVEALPRLREISDEWLKDKNAAEKRFSVGFYDETYLSHFAVAVVRSAETDRIEAFANVLSTLGREELTVDLMRYGAQAPRAVMTYLFTRLMLWGAENGYRSFDLGMAPLAGMEGKLGPSLWNRAAALVYRHGEHFYNFQGLRSYKEKFVPEWRPRYLACPGGLALPRVVGNLASLISGGVEGVFRK